MFLTFFLPFIPSILLFTVDTSKMPTDLTLYHVRISYIILPWNECNIVLLHRFAIKFGSRTCGGIHSTWRLFDSVIQFSHFLFTSILFYSLLSISFLLSPLILFYLILPYLILSYRILPYLTLSCLILSCLILSYLILSCFLFPLSSFLFLLNLIGQHSSLWQRQERRLTTLSHRCWSIKLRRKRKEERGKRKQDMIR